MNAFYRVSTTVASAGEWGGVFKRRMLFPGFDMYLDYFQLSQKPFEINTDPSFLWLGEKHREALSTLKYGIMERKRFLLLTGDVGLGKTTIINALLQALGKKDPAIAIHDPRFEQLDFFNYIARSFGLSGEFATKGAFVHAFRGFLENCRYQGRRVLLIIDECQHLTDELLEEVHFLSNLAVNGARVLNVFFAGQLEFNETLLRPQNTAIRHRITVNYNIEPLNLPETGQYIAYRLAIAGVRERVFDKQAVSEIYGFSAGYPRLINMIADRCMLTGYVRSRRLIKKDIVAESAEALDISRIKRPMDRERVRNGRDNGAKQPGEGLEKARRPAGAGKTNPVSENVDNRMDKVLIVDDDPSFLERAAGGLKRYQQFAVEAVRTRSDAVSAMNTNRVSVLVLAGDSPSINAIDLLSYMSRYHGRIPCIVMMSRKKPWFRSFSGRNAFLYYLEKPFQLSQLASAVIVGLNQQDIGINVNGISMASLLPLFEMLRKTGSLEISAPAMKNARMEFREGRICDARAGSLTGEAAAREIASWNGVTFDFLETDRVRVQSEVFPTLMELAGADWERRTAQPETSSPGPGTDEKEEEVIPIEDLVQNEYQKKEKSKNPAGPSFEIARAQSLLKKIVNDIRYVRGYQGVVFVNGEGGILAFDQLAENTPGTGAAGSAALSGDRSSGWVDVKDTAGAMAALFGTMASVAGTARLDGMEAFTLHTKRAHVIMQQIPGKAAPPIRAVIVCASGGNWFYLKNRIENLARQLRNA